MAGASGPRGQGEKHPDAVSGGEVQRAGIARALAHGPALVLADEPTGALDDANAARIAALLVAQAKEQGAAVVIATHDPAVSARADRVLRLREGRLAPADPSPPALLATAAESLVDRALAVRR